MSVFKLSLPTDIPWRRICVSRDMLDLVSCDDERPPRWRSSLAAFRYDPAEEYQPYEEDLVSYIKIVATLAPYQPEIDPGEFNEFLPAFELSESQMETLEESFPCYGAILQVSVAPNVVDLDQFPKDRYPYIIDCEPKKRELYEAVADTSEILSGSSSSLMLGKAATSTNSVESYNLDMGGAFGAAAQASAFGMGFGSSFNVENREQVGTVHRTTSEVANVRQSDMSSERRELFSHTTQLTQMYNLFQAFHLGTNRALFLMEPRPHVRQTEATFINGPRALEGVQEVFLVVVRPKAMADFCVSALLETAHLSIATEEEFEKTTRTEAISWRGPKAFHVKYKPDEGFRFDTGPEGTMKNPFVILPGGVWNLEPGQLKNDYPKSGEYLTFDADLKEGQAFIGDVELYMISNEAKVKEYVEKMFLSARELCCCPPLRMPSHPIWISAISDVNELRLPILVGRGGPRPFTESRRIAATVRQRMIQSFRSSRRQPRGKLQYTDSDVFHTRLAAVLRRSAAGKRLDVSLAAVDGITNDVRGRLYRARGGETTVEDVLTTEASTLARILDVDPGQVTQLKRTLLREIGRRTA